MTVSAKWLLQPSSGDGTLFLTSGLHSRLSLSSLLSDVGAVKGYRMYLADIFFDTVRHSDSCLILLRQGVGVDWPNRIVRLAKSHFKRAQRINVHILHPNKSKVKRVAVYHLLCPSRRTCDR